MKLVNVNNLIELAKEFEKVDVINEESVYDRDYVYNLFASQVIEQVARYEDSDREIILMASMLKLLVENFLLNAKLNENSY